MLGKGRQHVVQKANARLDIRNASSVEIQLNLPRENIRTELRSASAWQTVMLVSLVSRLTEPTRAIRSR